MACGRQRSWNVRDRVRASHGSGRARTDPASPGEPLPERAGTRGNDVTVTIGSFDDGTGIFVADDGCGIPDDRREEVFEHGYSTNEDGTGFGLAIIEEIAAAHGWNPRVTDAADGGARFEFEGVTPVDDEES